MSNSTIYIVVAINRDMALKLTKQVPAYEVPFLMKAQNGKAAMIGLATDANGDPIIQDFEAGEEQERLVMRYGHEAYEQLVGLNRLTGISSRVEGLLLDQLKGEHLGLTSEDREAEAKRAEEQQQRRAALYASQQRLNELRSESTDTADISDDQALAVPTLNSEDDSSQQDEASPKKTATRPRKNQG